MMVGAAWFLSICMVSMLLAGCGIPNIDVAELDKTISSLKNEIQALKQENDHLQRTVKNMQDSQQALSEKVSQLAARNAGTLERAGADKAGGGSGQPKSSSTNATPPPVRNGSGKAEKVDVGQERRQSGASERGGKAELCAAIETYLSDVESAMKLDVVSRDFALHRSFVRFEEILKKHKNDEFVQSAYDKVLLNPAQKLMLDATAVPKGREGQSVDSKKVDALTRHQRILRSFCDQ